MESNNGESGEKPELSRSCKGSRPAVALSQRGRQTMNRARVPFVFHHQKTRGAWAG